MTALQAVHRITKRKRLNSQSIQVTMKTGGRQPSVFNVTEKRVHMISIEIEHIKSFMAGFLTGDVCDQFMLCEGRLSMENGEAENICPYKGEKDPSVFSVCAYAGTETNGSLSFEI